MALQRGPGWWLLQATALMVPVILALAVAEDLPKVNATTIQVSPVRLDKAVAPAVKGFDVVSQHLKVTWPRSNAWSGVQDFMVRLMGRDGLYSPIKPCTTTFLCREINCTFDSSTYCDNLGSCAEGTVLVTASGFMANTVDFTTAPANVENMKISLTGASLTISWTRPNTDISRCFSGSRMSLNTAGRVAVEELPILPSYNSNRNLTACDVGTGELRICALGPGNGCSNHPVNTMGLTFTGEGVPTLVSNVVLTASSRNILLSWSLSDTSCNKVTYHVNWSSPRGSGTQTASKNSGNIFDLTPFTTYRVCVQAVGSDLNQAEILLGIQVCSDATTDQDVPGPPTINGVTPGGASVLVVEWTAPKEPNGIVSTYTVSWTATEANDTVGESHKVEAQILKYTITGLVNCVTYTVTVKAATSQGEGMASEGVEGYVGPEGFVPPVPNQVQIQDIEPRKLTLVWSRPKTLCPIDGYVITWFGYSLGNEHQTTSGSMQVRGEVEVGEVRLLQPYSNYTLMVCAVTPVQPGHNVTLNAVTAQDVPGPPSALKVSTSAKNSLLVQWVAPSNPNGLLTQYTVIWKPTDESSDADKVVIGTDIREYTITKLTSCQTYMVVVKATTSAGDGQATDGQEATTSADDYVPPAPLTPSVKNPGSRQLTVTWSSPPTLCVLHQYKVDWTGTVLWDASRNSSGTKLVSAREPLVLLVDSLLPQTKYSFRISATTDVFFGDTVTAEGQTLEDVPDAPTSLKVSPGGSSALLVEWGPPHDQNGVITGYTLTWTSLEGAEGSSHLQHNDTTVLSHTLSNLNYCGSYTVTMTATTRRGEGPPTKEIKVIAGSDGFIPPAPHNLSVTSVSARQMSLRWQRPETRCPLQEYVVSWLEQKLWGRQDATNHSLKVQGEDLTVVLEGLTPYSKYTMHVYAATVTDFGVDATVIGQTSQEAPDVPRNLTLMLVTGAPDTVLVSWLPPLQENGVLGDYNVTWGTDALEDLQHLTTIVTNVTVCNLIASTNYTISVQASTDSGTLVGPLVQDTITTLPPTPKTGTNQVAIMVGVGVALIALLVGGALSYKYRQDIHRFIHRKSNNYDALQL